MNEHNDITYALQEILILRGLLRKIFKNHHIIEGILSYSLGVIEEHVEMMLHEQAGYEAADRQWKESREAPKGWREI